VKVAFDSKDGTSLPAPLRGQRALQRMIRRALSFTMFEESRQGSQAHQPVSNRRPPSLTRKESASVSNIELKPFPMDGRLVVPAPDGDDNRK
jgi:hypothetical protein